MGIVTVEHLTKSYGGRPPALSDVSLEFGPGITGLLGPNGAGKSTLIMCVLGLLRDFAGTATVLGLDARRDRLAIRRKVGYMPEADSLIPGMSGVQSTRYLAELTGMRHDSALRRAHDCLHYVGLTDALYRPAEEYSTGMRQRLKLAQSLVHDPEILFLDEPVSGLDPEGRDEFLRLVKGLARDHGKHVVWSSHLLPDVQKVADAVLVLDRGHLRGSFRLEDLHAATGRFEVEGVGDALRFEDALVPLGLTVEPTEGAEHADEDGHFRRVVKASGEGAPPLLAAAHASGVLLRKVAPKSESLEEVFHRLLGIAPGREGERR